MKRPYYNYFERHNIIYLDTTIGQMMLLTLAWKKFKRELYRLLKKWSNTLNL